MRSQGALRLRTSPSGMSTDVSATSQIVPRRISDGMILDQEPGSKVPTMVTYLRDEPKTWGFTARSMRDGPEKTEEFGLGDLSIQPDERQHWHTYKLFKTKLQDAANPEDARRARECVQFYLEQLRIHIEQYSKMKFGLDKGNVKYVFSYPTTWQEGTKTVFESLIERAGYKRVRGQELFLTLNEATAAMAHFLVSPDRVRPSNGDLVLVADIGGATSDVSVCQIEYNDAKAFNNITIKASDPGFNTGATYIDDGYKEKLEALLREDIAKKVANTEAKQTDPAILASWTDEVVRSDLSHFEHQGEYIKQKHGFKGVSDADRLMRKTLVPFHSTTFSLAKVSIRQDEWFEELFDEQCSKVVQQFTDKKERLQRNEAIKYVILAGGLGCSEYVKKYLKREYKQYCPFGIPGFDVVEQPELAVSKGLVQYELSHLRERGTWHCKANVTFGIRQKDAEEVHLLFETDDPVQIGATKTVKMEVDFDTLGKLTTDLQLVWNENKPPEKSLIGKGDKYKSWAKEVQSVRDLTPLIKVR